MKKIIMLISTLFFFTSAYAGMNEGDKTRADQECSAPFRLNFIALPIRTLTFKR